MTAELSRRRVIQLTASATGTVLLPTWVFGKVARGTEAARPFTVVAMPDTQNYADTIVKYYARKGWSDLREYFYGQTRWVAENAAKENIVFLCHEGDIVQADAAEEWEIANKALTMLDGKVPYALALGNHDMGFNPKTKKCATTRSTRFNDYFPVSRFEKQPWYGGHFGRVNDNHWCRFTGGGVKFLVLALEFTPRDEVLAWANDVVAGHADHRVIVTTHWYLHAGGKRDKRRGAIPGNSGEQIWQKLVSRHKNILMVLCGHIAREAANTEAGAHGNSVHQLLADYQTHVNGGDGWLRLLKFLPAENTIQVRTFTTAHNRENKGRKSRFSLAYPAGALTSRP